MVSGPEEAVAQLEHRLDGAGRVLPEVANLACIPLADDGADHRVVRRRGAADSRSAANPLSSRTSPAHGSPPTEATDPAYWASHLRNTVRFSRLASQSCFVSWTVHDRSRPRRRL